MIKIRKYDNITIQVITDDRSYLADLKEYLTDYVENFRHMQKYKMGVWDGKISMFNMSNRTLPYGLLFDLLRFHKTKYNDKELVIDDDVKNFFIGINNIEPDYSLSIFPREYQIDCIEACLKHRSGLIVSSTASGKSAIISYVINTLSENNLIKKTLIIVPTISLVQQFYSDMVGYGIDEGLIGRVYSKLKEFDKEITISTWQTMKNNQDILDMYDSIIVDECLDENSLIKTPSGYTYIKNLKIGDPIISYNIEKKEFETDIIKKVYKNLSHEKMYKLTFDNGVVINITGNHKILTQRGYIRADCITENDEIISE